MQAAWVRREVAAAWQFGLRESPQLDGEAFLTLRSFVRAVSRRGALLAQGAENSRVCGLQAWMNQGAKALFHPLSSLDWRHSKAGFSQQEV